MSVLVSPLKSPVATLPKLGVPVIETVTGFWTLNRAGVIRSSNCSHRSRTNRAGRRRAGGAETLWRDDSGAITTASRIRRPRFEVRPRPASPAVACLSGDARMLIGVGESENYRPPQMTAIWGFMIRAVEGYHPEGRLATIFPP